jgi:hydroxymethylbilane synthase
MSFIVRIATRGSRLALWQAEWVKERLQLQGVRVELVIIETQGDRDRAPFAQMSGQGFFTKAVQDAVLEGRASLAVHSYKDLPSAAVEDLEVAAIPEREDPRELLLINPDAFDAGGPVLPLCKGARVGSSAVRRQAQLRHLRPDLDLLELRGNVPTRVQKLAIGEFDAVLLAYAGVKRLGLDLSRFNAVVLEPSLLVPAPAQGALALECRRGNFYLKNLLRSIHSPAAQATVAAERGLMAKLAGGCQLALGASARLVETGLRQAGDRPHTEYARPIELLAWYGGKLYTALGASPEEVSEAVFRLIERQHPEAVGV